MFSLLIFYFLYEHFSTKTLNPIRTLRVSFPVVDFFPAGGTLEWSFTDSSVGFLTWQITLPENDGKTTRFRRTRCRFPGHLGNDEKMLFPKLLFRRPTIFTKKETLWHNDEKYKCIWVLGYLQTRWCFERSKFLPLLSNSLWPPRVTRPTIGILRPMAGIRRTKCVSPPFPPHQSIHHIIKFSVLTY